MKKKILLTLIIAIFTFNILGVNIIAIATDEETNTWDVSENGDGSVIATLDENGTLTITGTGKMKNYAWSSIPGDKFSEDTKIVNIENGVTNIGNFAFYYCNQLTNITIPDSVTSIGTQAFLGCKSLTGITIPEGVTNIGEGAFEWCKSLTNIIIPEGVTSIGYCAFHGCESLTNITIPKGVTSIKWYTFGHCINLTNVEIPSSVTSIEEDAFSECTKLKNIEIPESVTDIGKRAFEWCESLTNINVDISNKEYVDIDGVVLNKDKTEIICYPAGKIDFKYIIPSSVTEIGDYAFISCENLTNITIPESVISIGEGAFGECTNLTYVEIPNSVTSIGDWAFSECINLTNINVDISNKKYMDIDGVVFNKDKTEIICYPQGKPDFLYVIPASVTEIGDYAFMSCENLTNITIPESVISIGEEAFSECTNLTYVEIPNSVTSIGDWAFSECINLTNVEIPSSVTNIGENMFLWSTITRPIEKNNEVILPDIIKRAMDPEDILYAGEDFEFHNCTLSEDKTKLIVTSDEEVRMKIKSGKLKGLTVEAIKVTKGDVNLDGKIDFQDILEINKYRLQKVSFELKRILASDVNSDGKVDFQDILKINKYRLGKIDSL